ncbi:hypothetical protein JCM19235_1354 [Vibrio maritimus]|uniref:Uncharacterized protein n=1 Tax=Vibrio maritimus TaxID=990268 RepID=A0A090S8E7_9VIBR|nr:hypothetical protein JCM19235_1354 [Vibrio maritimus]
MKIQNIESELTVAAEFVREDKDNLQLYSSMEGASEVQDAFFNALTESLREPKTINHHLTVAVGAATKVAMEHGQRLEDYGMYDSEPLHFIERIREKLSGSED